MKTASMKFSERHLKHLKQMSEKHKMKPADYVRKIIEDDIQKYKAPFDNLSSN